MRSKGLPKMSLHGCFFLVFGLNQRWMRKKALDKKKLVVGDAGADDGCRRGGSTSEKGTKRQQKIGDGLVEGGPYVRKEMGEKQERE